MLRKVKMGIEDDIYGTEKDKVLDKGICPECGAKLVAQEGCKHCIICGWSVCI